MSLRIWKKLAAPWRALNRINIRNVPPGRHHLGAPGADKTSLLNYLARIWRERDEAKEPTPIPVDIPVNALEGSEIFAQAIGKGLLNSLIDRAKRLPGSIKSLAVVGASISIDRGSSSSPQNLSFPRDQIVVLKIDEAQNLDL